MDKKEMNFLKKTILFFVFFLPFKNFGLEIFKTSTFSSEMSGYLKDLNLVFKEKNGYFSSDENEVSGISTSRVRFNLNLKYKRIFKFEVSIENKLWMMSNNTGAFFLFTDNSYFSGDEIIKKNFGNEISETLFIDRLMVKIKKSGFKLTLGKQSIGFGTSLPFSVIDIVNPFAPFDFDKEVRNGIYGINFEYFIDYDKKIGVISIFSNDLKNFEGGFVNLRLGSAGLFFITGAIPFEQYDKTAKNYRFLGGLAYETELFRGTLSIEAIGYQGTNSKKAGGDSNTIFFNATIGYLYKFENNLIIQLQFLRNGAGTGDFKNYPLLMLDPSSLYQRGMVYLLGENYSIFSLSYEIFPLLNFQLLTIFNITDISVGTMASFDYNALTDFDISLFFTYGIKTDVNDEFYFMPTSIALFLKYYF